MKVFFQKLGSVIFTVLYLAGTWAFAVQTVPYWGGWVAIYVIVAIIGYIGVIRRIWPRKTVKH